MEWMDDRTDGWMEKVSRNMTMMSFTICNIDMTKGPIVVMDK
jgi:hypothetical protein